MGCALALTGTFMLRTWFSTLTNGVIVLGLNGLAFLAGWIEQMSGFAEGSRPVLLGILSSLVMPSEAVWRRAAFEMESPLADISVPSLPMIGYAVVYMLIALSFAIYHFQQRDL